MSFLEDKCNMFPLAKQEEIENFTCGDSDLDEFFTKIVCLCKRAVGEDLLL